MKSEAVIRAIVKLSKALNLNIVAEGVETRAQKNILRQTGCPIIQGYLFSRPVAREAIDEMMSHDRKLTISDELNTNPSKVLSLRCLLFLLSSAEKRPVAQADGFARAGSLPASKANTRIR